MGLKSYEEMVNQQRIEHYLCLLRHAELFQHTLLIAFYQRKIDKLKEMK